jgi:hypothetical protein
MPEPRQMVREYIRACDQLLKENGLSDEEKHLLLEVTGRVTEMLLNWKQP